MPKYCPKCKETHVSGNYCPKCGTKLVDLPKCRECNRNLYPSNKFCTNCGRKVERGNQ